MLLTVLRRWSLCVFFTTGRFVLSLALLLIQADAQADLSLRWAHTHYIDFVMSWLISQRLATRHLNRIGSGLTKNIFKWTSLSSSYTRVITMLDRRELT